MLAGCALSLFGKMIKRNALLFGIWHGAWSKEQLFFIQDMICSDELKCGSDFTICFQDQCRAI
jgi:hypothetical protein